MVQLIFQAVLLGVLISSATATSSATCFGVQIKSPELPGGNVLSVSAQHGVLPAPTFSALSNSTDIDSSFTVDTQTFEFCNVTVVYTHPGAGDTITVQVLLPRKGWNKRFLAAGGGGWATGIFEFLFAPLAKGYAAAGTDGGHARRPYDGAETWAQISPGNVNLYALQNFASVALNDLAIIGKAVTTSFYSSPPKHSYWDGCSMGGRQGLMLAQRYPTAFDGIIAAAPAINLVKFAVSNFWAQVVMKELGVYPSTCELDAITAAAVKECEDKMDGVISNLRGCNFNPYSVVGDTISCSPDGRKIKISRGAAEVAKRTWEGAKSPSGKFLWYGAPYGSNLTTVAASTCSGTKSKDCVGLPFTFSSDWIQLWVSKNPKLDVSKIGYEEFARLFHISVQEYSSIIDTDDADLSEFRKAGGKMITWHGLDDDVITPYGSSEYYERAEKLDRDVRSFYRYFEVPGAAHCTEGKGAVPSDALGALVQWVEGGKAPSVLKATTPAGLKSHDVCQYPLISVFSGKGRDGRYECKGR